MNDLEMYREQLSLCDDKIIDALVERGKIVEKIMAYKEEYGMPILQPQQETKQKVRLEAKLEGNKYKEEIYDIFRRILRNSKRIQARKLFGYNIVLIGFMGAGKTTISDYLSTMFAMKVVEMDGLIAEREGMSIPDIFATYGEEYFRDQETNLLKEYLSTMFAMKVVEMDGLIAEREGMSIPDIFATYGEEYFRDQETNLLKELQEESNLVISCGGGAALRACNVAEMKKNGRVVLLTASPEVILDRVKDSDDRPVLKGRKSIEGITELMEQRRERYEAAADIVIQTDHKSVQEICEELIQRLSEMDEE